MKSTEIIEKEILILQKTYGSLPWEDKEFYKQYIAQTFFYVRNATRVLSKAAYKCSHQENDLHCKLIQSIIDEKDHEMIALSDLGELGGDIKKYKETPETAAYHLTLLAQIDLEGPYALLGYFIVVEGLAGIGANKVLNKIISLYGEEAAQFLIVHIKEDEHHYNNSIQYINSLPSDIQKIIVKNAQLSAALFRNLLLALK